MGAIYTAVDRSTGRRVALKRLLACEDETQSAMFEQEYRALARLRHPRIPEVYDYGVDAAGPYFTMELLDGRDLRELAPLPYRDACRYLRDVASTLALLHARRLLHRDVSPRNVRLTSEGRCKLIDFGTLITFGVPTDVVGTPPCLAPEVLHGAPLDGRVDLFALGAVAYWLLSGRHAFPARRLEDLPNVWQIEVTPVSTFAPDVPPELDDLVLSLLSVDAAARPQSAAYIVERLNAIAGLEREDAIVAAYEYLGTPALVGRTKELSALRDQLSLACGGSGGCVVVQGEAGTGKTRLLGELAAEARIKGALVIQVNAAIERGQGALIRAVARRVLDGAPTLASDTLQAHPRLGDYLEPRVNESERPSRSSRPAEPAAIAADRAEHRTALVSAFVRWLLDLAEHRPLVLLVDNVQGTDELSASGLALLARSAKGRRVFVGTSLRLGEPQATAGSFAVLRAAGTALRLEGLSASGVRDLVESLFGSVPNTGRLANRIHQQSAGNPFHCVELARHLVKSTAIRYTESSWVLPQELPEEALPAGLEAMLHQRVASLTPLARRVAEVVSVRRGRVMLDTVLRVLSEEERASIFGALDELAEGGVLAGSSGEYWFSHGAVRQRIADGFLWLGQDWAIWTVRPECWTHSSIAILGAEGHSPSARFIERASRSRFAPGISPPPGSTSHRWGVGFAPPGTRRSSHRSKPWRAASGAPRCGPMLTVWCSQTLPKSSVRPSRTSRRLGPRQKLCCASSSSGLAAALAICSCRTGSSFACWRAKALTTAAHWIGRESSARRKRR